MSDRLLSASEVAERIGLAVRTVQFMMSRRELPYCQVTKGKRMVPEGALSEWIKQNTVSADPDFTDDEAVSYRSDKDGNPIDDPMTFGHIRRVRAALNTAQPQGEDALSESQPLGDAGELDADHLLIDLLFIAGTMDANYRWLEEAFNARLDEPLDIEMMKEARRRFEYWKDLQAKLYNENQIAALENEKYEKSLSATPAAVSEDSGWRPISEYEGGTKYLCRQGEGWVSLGYKYQEHGAAGWATEKHEMLPGTPTHFQDPPDPLPTPPAEGGSEDG